MSGDALIAEEENVNASERASQCTPSADIHGRPRNGGVIGISVI